MVCIGVSQPGQYTEQYLSNAEYVPMYFVHGQIEGAPMPLARNGKALDSFIQSTKYDFMYVSYPGRGRDYFLEELPRIIEWMNLASHVRIKVPRVDQGPKFAPWETASFGG